MALRLRRKEIAPDAVPPPPSPVVQPYDDAALRAEIASLKAQISASLQENARLVQKLIDMENAPDPKCEYGFDVEYNDDLTIRRIVARETNQTTDKVVKPSTTKILYG